MTKIFFPSEDPLEIVTGDAPRKPPPVPLARLMADLNSLAPLPPIRRRRVHVEVPEKTDMERLQERFVSERQ